MKSLIREWRISLVFAAFGLFAIVLAACTAAPRQTEQLEPVRISVDASQDVREFSANMRGVGTNNWNWLWSGISESDSDRRAALIEATRLLKPGVIRFAGGLWANGVGWDREGVSPTDGQWTYSDPTTGESFQYRHAYRPAMIDSYAAFANEVGAETIVQVNICDNNPAMWADLLRYTNLEHDYSFKFWELGNELDQDQCISVDEYADRFVQYSAALKSVDPDILILGPSVASITQVGWFDALTEVAGDELDVLSFHWYQLTNWSDDAGSFAYEGGSTEALLSHFRGVGTSCHSGFGCPGAEMSFSTLNRITYRRGAAEAVKQEIIDPIREDSPDLLVALTETGVHAVQHQNPINGNHTAAIWLADMLGRWAYNGVDILTYYSLEDGTDGFGNTRGLLGVDGLNSLDVRPTFLTVWLYAQHFGDVLVETESNHFDQQVVAWASRDTSDPNALKLMIVNLSDQAELVEFDVSGFEPQSGQAFTMASPDPLSAQDPQSFAGNLTTINGTSIPDVLLDDPLNLEETLNSIQPISVQVGSNFTSRVEPYTVVALTLRK